MMCELAAGRDLELVWRNEPDGFTVRFDDQFVTWNPRRNGIDLERGVDAFLGGLEPAPPVGPTPQYRRRLIRTTPLPETASSAASAAAAPGNISCTAASTASSDRLRAIDARAAIFVPSWATSPTLVIPAIAHNRSEAMKQRLQRALVTRPEPGARGVVGREVAAHHTDLSMSGLEDGMRLVAYFEIPVTDLDRAAAFYEVLLGVRLERTVVDGHPMALFPPVDGAGQATGALAAGESYVPSVDGTRVYFEVDDVAGVLARGVAGGGLVLYPPTSLGDGDQVAELEDTEGNRIALLSRT
jgi:predicted enzyme related to lactoylglutathione lyase